MKATQFPPMASSRIQRWALTHSAYSPRLNARQGSYKLMRIHSVGYHWKTLPWMCLYQGTRCNTGSNQQCSVGQGNTGMDKQGSDFCPSERCYSSWSLEDDVELPGDQSDRMNCGCKMTVFYGPTAWWCPRAGREAVMKGAQDEGSD